MTETQRSLRRTQIIGMALVAVLLLAIFGWGAQAEIAGAIIARAIVAVKSSAKEVQHLEGGIVKRLHVENGDRVSVGALLIELDDTEARAAYQIVESQFHEMLAEQARLEAERDQHIQPAQHQNAALGADCKLVNDARLRGTDGDPIQPCPGGESLHLDGEHDQLVQLIVPAALADKTDDPEIAKILNSQSRLLASRIEGISSKKQQLREQVMQLHNQIDGMQAQYIATVKKAEILSDEIADLQPLLEKALVAKNSVQTLERQAADVNGEAAQLKSEIARLRGKIIEIDLKILQVDEDWRA